MPKLSDQEYASLKKFVGLFYDWYMAKPGYPKDIHPLRVLERAAKQSIADAKRGLQMAIHDVAEDTADWLPEAVAAADARFAKSGALTLSEVRRRYQKSYAKVLKRGEIRSETEYYLIKGIADGADLDPNSSESQLLAEMMRAFESKALH
jgi:hypothetical protein